RSHPATHMAKTNRDVLPLPIWEDRVKPARAASGMAVRQFQAAVGLAYCGDTCYQAAVSRARAVHVASLLPSELQSEEALRLAASDVYWDRVARLELDGDEPVYDLTVEGLHNFVAGDIVVHNSLEQDSDVVMFIYRDEIYNPDTDRKNIADIIVAKHRNGPVGQVSLYFQAAQTRFRDLDLRTPDDY